MRGLRIASSSLRSARYDRPRHAPLQRPPSANSFQRATFVATAQRNARNNILDDENININVFEDEVGGQGRRKRRRLSEEEVEDMKDGPRQRTELADPDDIIREASAKGGILDQAKHQLFSEEDLARMRSFSLRDMVPHQVHAQGTIPKQSQIYLQNLNEAMDGAMDLEDNPDPEAVVELWRWYLRCKHNVPDFLRMIPREGWRLLWKSQSYDSAWNPNRAHHLRTLAEDKQAAGWTLTEDEDHARMEGLFLDGQQGLALAEYAKAVEVSKSPSAAFLEMGMRMYSVNGEPHEALALWNRHPAKNGKSGARMLISVIKALAEKHDEASLLQAYGLYLEMRRLLGSDMNMGDFDLVSLEFLGAGHTEFAFAVFRDMMISGNKQPSLEDSEILSRVGEFIASGSAEQSTGLSLDAIKYLPRRYQNKYFYASWIKKLLGEGQTNAASMVVELMYERGIRPDPKHLNGLISVMAREEDEESRTRAEGLAWSMIQRRLDFTERRRNGLLHSPEGEDVKSPKSVQENDEGVTIPLQTGRPLPAATIETFSFLLQHYARRQYFGHVRHLRNLLVDAEIPMNTFVMNHLLYVELRTRGYEYTFARYQMMTKTVAPDLETFLCLWQAMREMIHDMRVKQRRNFNHLPNQRGLFDWMMKWFNSLDDKARAQVIEDMSPDIYSQIIRAFCFAHDLKGTFVALYKLRALFGAVPEDESTRHLLTMFGALQPISPNKLPKARGRALVRRRIERKDQTAHQRDMQNATIILDTVRSHRASRYEDDGVHLQEMQPPQQAEEMYRAILETVWTVLRRSEGAAETQAIRVLQAAQEMGVGEFDPEAAMQLLTDD